jgi:glycosyltransferase involved in cell wall biosynthesis
MKNLLYIIPYKELYPPQNGGMLRNYFLCLELSRYFNVTLVCFQPGKEFIEEKEGYEWNHNIRVVTLNAKSPSNKISKIFNSIIGRWYQRSLFRSAGTYMIEGYPKLRSLLKKNFYDCVVFAHVSSLELARLVRKVSPHSKVILDAHNVDHLLFAQENDITVNSKKKEFEFIKKSEEQIRLLADGIITCSFNDFTILNQLNESSLRGVVVPNGTDTGRNSYQVHKDNRIPHLIFCGSLDYEPNIDGLNWFVSEVWPFIHKKSSNAVLTIIGRNPSFDLRQKMISLQGINFVGPVKDVRVYYHQNSLAIVPLLKGSGTRLKILEAMALGIPVVSTTKGAEGIDVETGNHILLADNPETMSNAVLELLSNSIYYQHIRLNARRLVENKYSWSGSGLQFKDFLNQICS